MTLTRWMHVTAHAPPPLKVCGLPQFARAHVVQHITQVHGLLLHKQNGHFTKSDITELCKNPNHINQTYSAQILTPLPATANIWKKKKLIRKQCKLSCRSKQNELRLSHLIFCCICSQIDWRNNMWPKLRQPKHFSLWSRNIYFMT